MITFRTTGRLGNIIKSIFSTFCYCKRYNISYDEIFFKYNFLCHKCYFLEQFPFFINIKKYFDKKRYLNIKNEDFKTILYTPDFKNINNYKNIIFKRRKWDKFNIDLELFKKIFYNEDLFYNIANKYNIEFKNTLGIHIRRKDFLKVHSNNSFITLDKLLLNNKKFDKIYVFSDDIKWCLENIKINNVEFPENIFSNIKVYESLICLSMCDEVRYNHKKSTFGETGFYLNFVRKNI